MLDALWYDEHFACLQRDSAVTELDVDFTLQSEEKVVGIGIENAI
jgi:hypothetical protein